MIISKGGAEATGSSWKEYGAVRMIQWRGGNEYLLMDPPAHFKVWKRQFVKTKEHWASSDAIKSGWSDDHEAGWGMKWRELAQKESGEIKDVGVPQHELAHSIVTTIVGFQIISVFKMELSLRGIAKIAQGQWAP